MSINERIRFLRKSNLKMSQKDFAEKLGMKQTSVSSFEKEGATVTDHTVKVICTVFNINEQWLRTGEGDIYASSQLFCLDDYVKERGGSELELEILKILFELDPETRKAALEFFKHFTNKNKDAAAIEESTGNTGLIEPTTEDLEAEYKKIILNQQSEQAVTASSFTNGSSAKVAE